jgi:hypothetical protein
MGGECGMCGGGDKYIQGYDGGKIKVKGHLEEPGILGRRILKYM